MSEAMEICLSVGLALFLLSRNSHRPTMRCHVWPGSCRRPESSCD
jgi:hypothetical protein